MKAGRTTTTHLVLLEPRRVHVRAFQERFAIIDFGTVLAGKAHVDATLHSDRGEAFAIRCKTASDIRSFVGSWIQPRTQAATRTRDLPWSSRARIQWLAFGQHATDVLLRVLSRRPADRRFVRRSTFLALEPCRSESVPALATYFRRVSGTAQSFTFLAFQELVEVLALPDEEVRDLVIGGVVDASAEVITLTRGDGSSLVVPFSAFPPAASGPAPNFGKFSVTDYGRTIKLGEYEAATDAILYEFDRDFRQRLKARRQADERTFGSALRRLRKQRRLQRTDFGRLSAKTIARIERGETIPRAATRRAIAERLGVGPDEIEDY
jgi:hypothetical protein